MIDDTMAHCMSLTQIGNGPVEVSDAVRLAEKPLVSVMMITYNHAKYLAEAIEGVVSQQCDFPFELIIGEDASSDGALQIALDYQKRYPEIIRVVHSRSNVGMNANGKRIFERARGEFLAYCEGDDYWCRTDKLARQVALMRSDPGIGIVHTDWVRSRFKSGAWRFNAGRSVHHRVPARLLQGDLCRTWHFPKILRTCTVLLRRATVQHLMDSDLAKKQYRFGDSVLNAYVALQWRVGYVPAVAAVYRISPNSALRSGTRARVSFYKSCLEFDDDACAFFGARAGYGGGYRWESGMGLLLWAMRARNVKSAFEAIRDLRRHFGVLDFIKEGWRAVALRLPTLRRQQRMLPGVVGDAAKQADHR